MKKIKWLVAFLIVANLLLGVIGCKDPEIHIHTYSEAWTSDETNHWHAAICEHTDEKSGKAAHSFGEYVSNNDATTEEDGTKTRECSVCKYKDTVKDEGSKIHVHTYSAEWTYDAENHWHKATCEHTTEVSDKAEHTFGEWTTTKDPTEEEVGSKERVCSVCNYKETAEIEKLAHTHKFSSDWTYDGTHHWYAATCEHTTEVSGKAEHSFGEYVSNNDATTEADGTKTRECSVCGYKDKVTDEGSKIHVHTFAESLTKDETNHWYAATCEHTTEVSEKAEHTFGDWTVTKAATEEAEGSRERSCTVCEYTATEAIEKLAHTHKFATDWTKDETNHWHVSTCGHEVTDGKATHTFGEWQVTKAATEEAEGSRERSCTVCGYTATEVIGKAEHSFGEYVSNNDATTEADGTKTRECSVCGYKDTVTDEGSKIIVPEGFVYVKGGTVANILQGIFKGRTVTLSDFYMGKYEVTQEEYASVMKGQKVTVNGTDYALESNPSYCTADSTSYTLFNGDVQEKRPVEGVTWYDSVWYCNALSEKEGLTKAYNIEVTQVKQASGKTGYYIYQANVTLNKNANGYRLPTEAEWEYAARGGDPTKEDWNYVFSGADTAEGGNETSSKNPGLDSVGWYRYNNMTGITGRLDATTYVAGSGTHQVGKKAPNRLGLYDMSGNVWEWCYDLHGTITTTTPADGATSGSYRIYRGGSWFDNASTAYVAVRGHDDPYDRDDDHGFRVVRPSSK